MLRLVLQLVSLHTVMATITMAGSGARFESKPDPILGERLTDGYEYMARLQHLADNLDLCPSAPTIQYNITVPPDGLPVVLLARGAYCSDVSKARMASLNMLPRHVVKYLIIYDSDDSSLFHYNDIESIHLSGSKTVIEGTTAEGLEHKRASPPRYTKDINVYVLHTSLLSGVELLHILLSQDAADLQMGGPRVLLDGKTMNDDRLKNVLFGVAIAVMISGCLCSFLLSIQLNDMLGQEVVRNNGAPRDPRRQLTAEQVNEWLPIISYRDDEEMGGEACSICLDDLNCGEEVRQLPCKHVFHEDCVGKWLTERSSTCPLCKLDLLQQAEEMVETDDTSTQALVPSFWQGISEWWRGTTDSSSSSISMHGGAAQPLLADYQADILEELAGDDAINDEDAELSTGSTNEEENEMDDPLSDSGDQQDTQINDEP